MLGTRQRPKTLTAASPESPSPKSETLLKSPTWSLTELLQALEEPDKDSMWYVDRGNELCRLLARFPGLKWELSWSAFIGRYAFLLCNYADVELMRSCGERGKKKLLRDIELRDTRFPTFIV